LIDRLIVFIDDVLSFRVLEQNVTLLKFLNTAKQKVSCMLSVPNLESSVNIEYSNMTLTNNRLLCFTAPFWLWYSSL